MSSGRPTVFCARVIERKGTLQADGSRLDDDELCDRAASTDVIVTFNGNAYVVPLCPEHKAHHDQAAADRRKRRHVPNPSRRQLNLLETALTRTQSGGKP